MYRYKRILVNLNLDENDASLIKFASKIAEMAHSEKIYFLYTEKQLDIPEELLKEYPQLTESAGDFARDKITKSLAHVIEIDDNLSTTIIIEEGQALDEILKQVRINGIDLVLYGLSDNDSQSRSLATKLARKATCSVLIVPEGSELNLSNTAVAVDFSDHSVDAMDAALAFVKAGGNQKLKMFNIYQVPSGYYKTGKTYEQFAEIMKKHAQSRFEEFSKNLPIDNIHIEENYILQKKVIQGLIESAENNKITFMTVGARGRTAGAAVMLGSVTESLIENINIPLLAVKKKGSGISILNAILN